ncbi:DNA polymerase eta-like [Pyrus ussuriensis x Pyrus communis]|uniref:DNA polymerase eta-like n=1 Tax=Pyrus ussuriensis x Pyrus communis TaxID=2448454 RepID=A0A5N5FJ42_9ROSA|nr:DNA polymerase eta-like [Pyrus ussuriensis x Pyrus communis]
MAGSEVVSILAMKGRCERASIDEVYLDLTDAAETMLVEAPPESLEVIEEEALKSHVLGLQSEDSSDAKEMCENGFAGAVLIDVIKLLACGALIVAELRLQVLKETEFTCSAGIAHNKMLAKLASGMNKPAQQTIVPFSSVKGLLDPLPIKKIFQRQDYKNSMESIPVPGYGILLEGSAGKKLRGAFFRKAMVLGRHFLDSGFEDDCFCSALA